MLHTLNLLPLEFWLTILILIVGLAYGLKNIRRGTGTPILVVLLTVFAWYMGDVLYNDYENNHRLLFSNDVLSQAWLQVFSFIFTFLLFSISLRKYFIQRKSKQVCTSYLLYKKGINNHQLQRVITIYFKICLGIWISLVVLAFLNVGLDAIRFVVPFIGDKVNPFGRGQLSIGILSSIFAFASYLYLLVGAGFGIVAALSLNKKIRRLAIIGVILVWSYFLLDRTRNTMLAVMLPGILSWVFFRLRSTNIFRIGLLFFTFIMINAWFTFVMDVRNQGGSVASSFMQGGLERVSNTSGKHLGLNMYEELCWLNDFIDKGSFNPNWGKRYFAELVNPIPRAFWPGKPLIGIDYSIARGQRSTSGDNVVTGTVATGLIGQGVNNFGKFLGPIAAGLLMSLWVLILARIDLDTKSYLRLPLFLTGLVLTFNLGRDITLIVLYPFLFGLIAVRLYERLLRKRSMRVAH